MEDRQGLFPCYIVWRFERNEREISWETLGERLRPDVELLEPAVDGGAL